MHYFHLTHFILNSHSLLLELHFLIFDISINTLLLLLSFFFLFILLIVRPPVRYPKTDQPLSSFRHIWTLVDENVLSILDSRFNRLLHILTIKRLIFDVSYFFVKSWKDAVNSLDVNDKSFDWTLESVS